MLWIFLISLLSENPFNKSKQWKSDLKHAYGTSSIRHVGDAKTTSGHMAPNRAITAGHYHITRSSVTIYHLLYTVANSTILSDCHIHALCKSR